MPELPASVRLALWATAALAAGGPTVEEAVRAATPDLDEIDAAPAVARIDLWAQLGERVVLVTLPAPGDVVGLPGGNPDLFGAAIDAGECAWSPLVGGALVPSVETFGPAGDTSEVVRWEAFDCAPPSATATPASIGQVERELRSMLVETTAALESLDTASWRAGLRDLADERLALGRWGLPRGLSDRSRSVVAQAATVLVIAETALETVHDAPSLLAGEQRARILTTVQRQARRALASAACAAGLELAG